MPNWTHEELLAAARAIRSYLSTLVTDYEAVDEQLASLLAKERAGDDVELDLIDALTSRDPLRKWTNQFLTERCPPQANRTRMGGPTFSLSAPVSFERYSCPQGDFDWFRFAPGDRVPQCPTHRTALVPPVPRRE